jgi:hypothetical protein
MGRRPHQLGTTLVAPWHFCQKILILVDSHAERSLGRVHAHTARVLTKCPRVSLNTFCAATCSNLYHISHTHPVQIALRFHFRNGSRSPAPQQSEEIYGGRRCGCAAARTTRARANPIMQTPSETGRTSPSLSPKRIIALIVVSRDELCCSTVSSDELRC